MHLAFLSSSELDKSSVEKQPCNHEDRSHTQRIRQKEPGVPHGNLSHCTTSLFKPLLEGFSLVAAEFSHATTDTNHLLTQRE